MSVNHDAPSTDTPDRGVAVGWMVPPEVFRRPVAERNALLHESQRHGIDHLAVGDHVSFFVGVGFDGLAQATALLAATEDVAVHTAVYLLGLRHPVPTARTISTIAEIAPGRLHFGIGLGGEDRHEFEVCGVDPSTRGARTDEALQILGGLLAGRSVRHRGVHFDIEDALVRPAPSPRVPVRVGGRSDAAIRRAGRFGDGWLAIWVSPERFSVAASQVETLAREMGRTSAPDSHELNVWCGLGDDVDEARRRLAATMEAFYATPFSRFERYCPLGQPRDVAQFLSRYVDAGCRSFNLITADPQPSRAIEHVAAVGEQLRALVDGS